MIIVYFHCTVFSIFSTLWIELNIFSEGTKLFSGNRIILLKDLDTDQHWTYACLKSEQKYFKILSKNISAKIFEKQWSYLSGLLSCWGCRRRRCRHMSGTEAAGVRIVIATHLAWKINSSWKIIVFMLDNISCCKICVCYLSCCVSLRKVK